MFLTEFSSPTRLRSKCTQPALNKLSKVKAKCPLIDLLNQSKNQNMQWGLIMNVFPQMYLVDITELFSPMVRRHQAKRIQWRWARNVEIFQLRCKWKITFTYLYIIFPHILSVEHLLGSWSNALLCLGLFDSSEVIHNQVQFIYMALCIIQIASKLLYSENQCKWKPSTWWRLKVFSIYYTIIKRLVQFFK